jgi:hypothetical protein
MTAYDVIKKYGWVQGHFGSIAKGFCMLGALTHVYPSHSKRYSAISCVEDVIDLSIVSWNDAPGRTKRQVLAALKKARV